VEVPLKFWPFKCASCAEKERLIETLAQDVLHARTEVEGARVREQSAVNALLQWQLKPQIHTPSKMMRTEAEQAHKQAFGFFKDELDDGKGNILEADQFPEGEPVRTIN